MEQEKQVETPQTEEPKVPTFTQEQVNEMIKKNINDNNSKWKKQLDEQEAKAKEQAELAQMNELEKANALAKKFEDEAKAKSSELENLKQMQQTIDILKEKNIDIDFAPFLIKTGDNEATMSNIEAFKTRFDEAVVKGVEAQIKPNVPSSNQTGITDLTDKALRKAMGL